MTERTASSETNPAPAALLEHVNYTVADPGRTASMLQAVFGWTRRWEGPSISGGRTVHVGTQDRYVALFSKGERGARPDNYATPGGLNHLGIVVEDLGAAERRVRDYGLKPHSHQTYDPGSRFYFHDADGIEYEVVSYG
ncbi:glyoxalase [Pacificimonas flava]|uniref:Glyoxalase n=2 Tax=Pacificimonas TaxID=1960290 RepID=A0A219B8G4_9SPHN|nr:MULTISPECIES: VOC family protein [Pacificimonas]MBZ6377244.1 VOC family protein [Pacificimonas aurantium]OWV34655.1 glyoxalase [Pacificimonas flava]